MARLQQQLALLGDRGAKAELLVREVQNEVLLLKCPRCPQVSQSVGPRVRGTNDPWNEGSLGPRVRLQWSRTSIKLRVAARLLCCNDDVADMRCRAARICRVS